MLAELNSFFRVKADLPLVRPAAGELVDGAPVLEWQTWAAADHYHLLILDDQAYPPQVVVDTFLQDTRFTVMPELKPGSYSWTVQAQDSHQAVLAELNSRFTVRAPLEILDPLPGAEVGVAPTFYWTAFEGAVQYQVIVLYKAANPPDVILDNITKGTQLFVDPPLQPDTAYSLTIRALDGRGEVVAEASSTFSVYGTGPFSDCGQVHVMSAAECQVLVSLYQATGGPAWANGGDWLTTNTPCTWPGVTCTGGHVTDLNLFYMNLTGNLPAALADLTDLRVLALRDNQLTGAIPPALGRLEQLVSLDLSHNQLSGSLPAELGQLKTLEFLFLFGNQLSGELPAAWGSLPALRHLDLSSNLLSGAIPPEWSHLLSLQSLRLGHNQLSGALPTELVQLAQLTEFDVSYNQLTGAVPPALLTLPNRALWGNQFDGTIQMEGAPPMAIDYQGVSFICFSSLGASVWPDLLPAIAPQESLPFWEPRPAHLRFTLAGAPGADQHFPFGAALTNQAQVLIFPVSDYEALDRQVRLQMAALRHLLAERPAVVDDELPLLPLTNTGQALHARLHYLDFTNGSGVSYLTQASMGPSAINNQELYYTFQGLTNDRSYYVAAYFPVAWPSLPATGQLSEEEFATLMADYPAYLTNIAAQFDVAAPEAFTPDLAQIDRLLASLQVH